MHTPRNDPPPPPTLLALAGLFQQVYYNFTAESLSSPPLSPTSVLRKEAYRRHGSRKQERRKQAMFLFYFFWYPAIQYIPHTACWEYLLQPDTDEQTSQVHLMPMIQSCILELETSPSTSFSCLSVWEISTLGALQFSCWQGQKSCVGGYLLRDSYPIQMGIYQPSHTYKTWAVMTLA